MDLLLLPFINKYLDLHDVGDTPDNRGQCVGLIEIWLDEHKHPHIWGNAKDLLDNAPAASYHVIRNLPDNAPPPGAIVCWDGTWGNGAGHTAVVLAANVHHLVVMEQNNPVGAACCVGTHDYTGVQGWLVPA